MPFLPGVGPTEMIIIVVAALMIFGPSKLPEVMGQAGKILRDLRNMTGNLQGEFEKSLNEAAGTDVRQTLSSEIANLKGEVQSATNAVTGTKTTSTAAPKPVTSVAATTTTPAKPATTTAIAKPGTTAPVVSVPASKANPLADVTSGGEIAMAPVRTSTRRNRVAAASPVNSAPAAVLPKSSSAILPGSGRAAAPTAAPPAVDGADPFARARQRRQSAGYQAGPGAQAD